MVACETVCAGNRELKTQQRGLINVSAELLSSLGPTHCPAPTSFVWVIPRPRILQHIWGLGLPFYHKPCICNELVALSNRVLSPTESVTAVGHQKLKELKRVAIDIGRSIEVEPLSMQSFIDGVKVPGKRKIYARAAEDLKRRDLNLGELELEMFIKSEPVHGESKDCRAIQFTKPHYNILFGVFNKPIENLLGKMPWANGFGPATPPGRLVAKGLNNIQRGALIFKKWKRFKNPCVVGIDASRFDMHVDLPWLDVEFALYLAAYSHDKHLHSLLRWQKHCRGRSKNGIRYRPGGGRASGLPNTGSGNSIICVVLALGFLTKLGIPFDFLCDGDDALIFVEAVDLNKLDGFASYCANLGFAMKVEDPVYSMELIEFCQCHPVEVRKDKWIMVRDPKRAIYRGCMSNTSMSTVLEAEQTMWAIGSCELALHSGVPIMQEYAMFCLRNGIKPSERKLELIRHKLSHQYWNLPHSTEPRPVTLDARLTFAEAFGVPISEQLLIEESYRRSTFKMTRVNYEVPALDTGAGEVYQSDSAVYIL